MNPIYAWKVFYRNLRAWWKLGWAIIINALDPLIFLAAFGLGLGKLIGQVDGMPYLDYIAPAMVAIAALYGSFFETTYNAFVRMYYDRLYEAYLSTRVNLEELVIGEIAWGTFRGSVYALLVIIVLMAFQIISPPDGLVMLVLSIPVALNFSALGLLMSGVVPSITFFDYIYFVYISPMMLFSETYFPLKVLPDFLRPMVPIAFPLYHGVRTMRQFLMNGEIPLLHITPVLLSAIALTILSIMLMRRRLIK